MSTTKQSSQPKLVNMKPNTVSIKTQYLVLYNLLSFIFWLGILFRLGATVILTTARWGLSTSNASTALSRYPFLDLIYPTTTRELKWTQTLALVEIAHAATGLVRTSVTTTGMQVASRLLLVWGVLYMFGQGLLVAGSGALLGKRLDSGLAGIPGLETALGLAARTGNAVAGLGIGGGLLEVEKNQAAYTGMILAWSVTECIRYLYFVFFIGSSTNSVPALLGWLRYNTFFVLYPLGISCECWLIYRAIPFAANLDARYALFLQATLAIYVPGSYILYSHMMTQRRKVMKGKGKAKAI